MSIWGSLTTWLGGRARPELARQMADLERRVFALSIDEARARVEPLLTDSTRYHSSSSPPTAVERARLEDLAPALREFMERFQLVEEVYGDGRFGRALLQPAEYHLGFTRVGTDAMHTEVVARPGEAAVYSVDGSEERFEQFEAYPSIYHYLLMSANIIYPPESPG